MTAAEQKMLTKGVAAGTIIGLALGLIAALFVVLGCFAAAPGPDLRLNNAAIDG
jgi:hypothetical protein